MARATLQDPTLRMKEKVKKEGAKEKNKIGMGHRLIHDRSICHLRGGALSYT
jgi:hypothetical protein